MKHPQATRDCLDEDPFSCGLHLPPGGIQPRHGGARNPGGAPSDGGVTGGSHDSYSAAMRAPANTRFGMQRLASIGW